MVNSFIPIEVSKGNNWYMDISNLSLSELIALKNELTGTIGYAALDSVIYEKSNITFDTYNNLAKREFQRNKEILLKPKKHVRNKYRRN